MNPLRVFIGYDSREPIALHVLSHSILRRATRPVSITPLALNHLADWLYTRERTPKESTEFSFTRFLVPYLSGYEGVSIFMDSDMLCLTDLGDLAWYHDPSAAVSVCQHDYVPTTTTKFLGQPQSVYPRKNWSSFMVFDNARCRALTPAYVNTASGLDLHRLLWAERIGAIPLDWNWLVGEYEPNPYARILHYTLGGPWFPATADCDHAKDWWAEKDHMEGGCRSIA